MSPVMQYVTISQTDIVHINIRIARFEQDIIYIEITKNDYSAMTIVINLYFYFYALNIDR